jgi:hypothetical protein
MLLDIILEDFTICEKDIEEKNPSLGRSHGEYVQAICTHAIRYEQGGSGWKDIYTELGALSGINTRFKLTITCGRREIFPPV